MARIQQLDPKSTSGTARRLLDKVERQYGVVPNFMRAFANSPSALGAFMHASGNLGSGALDAQTGERIALAMAEANGCQYCVSAHTTLAEQAGLDAAEIEAARRGESSDARADAAVKFAKSVLSNMGDVTTGELNELRAAGYHDGEIVEIISHVAVNTWTNLLGKVGQIDIDFPRISLFEKAA